jgi:sporulation protein YlmC with PRC-barrel domain
MFFMATRKFAIAKQLGGKRVITNKGEEIGRLSDVTIDEKSGTLELLLIEPAPDSKLATALAKDDEFVQVPFKAVFAVSDVIVVDEAMIAQ